MAESLSALAAMIDGDVVGDGAVAIDDVVHDHRDCSPGKLFVARRGLTVDGHSFVADAGACSAVCVERAMGVATPQLVVGDTNRSLGLLAAQVHGRPFEALRAVGVTGTNGKTTVARLIGSIAEAAGMVPAVAGTLGSRVGSNDMPMVRTSPEASDLHRMAAAMVEAGADVAAFEVSSHALRLQRVTGARFAVAAFTNLTADHLDFHADMEDYFAAKSRLFSPDLSDRAVIWVDDPYGAMLAEATSLEVMTVGSDADVRIGDIVPSAVGTQFELFAPDGGSAAIDLPLPGVFNVDNAAVAAATCLQLGLDLPVIAAGMASVDALRGRFELVDGPWPFTVYVDYAHTPDGITNAIAAARQITDERVLVVFGAGGDRDASKRPLMGSAASAADVVVVTNDNPRSEDPVRIADEVAGGVTTGAAEVVLDRREAIFRAMELAGKGDVVLVLGKGHETGQEFADRTDPFDDVAVVRQLGQP